VRVNWERCRARARTPAGMIRALLAAIRRRRVE
jgi:hypothetical protein